MSCMRQWYALASVGRLALMGYGAWQDANMAVKFTDVDYYVFSDAAEFVFQGKSPYLRPTYRYTPLLAWILTLNFWLTPLFGKAVFIIFDILVGHAIFRLVQSAGHGDILARNCALIWLFNPISATVSSRGNAESVMAFLVLTSLTFLVQKRIILASLFYALSIHVKIYPITYALPIYLYLGFSRTVTSENLKKRDSKNNFLHKLISTIVDLMPNKERIIFAAVSFVVLGFLTLSFYWMYGWTFVYETYLYHIVRGDIKHNFSPYFYLLYLTADVHTGVPLCLHLLVFLPQVMLLVAVGVKFYKDQPLAWFSSTFVFVIANKVCTSQYFLWYLSILPVIIPNLKMTWKKGGFLTGLWFLGQGLWLLPAYYLEFKGHNTFLYIWAAGLVFFIINAIILHSIVSSYSCVKIKKN